MIKKIVYILCLVPFFVFGQKGIELDTVKQGKPYNTSRKSNFSGFLGKNEMVLFACDYLSINRKKQELNLTRFDVNTLELLDERNLYTVIDEAYYNEPHEIFFQNNTVFLFSTLIDDNQEQRLIYVETFNEYGEKTGGRIIDSLNIDDEFEIRESQNKAGFILAAHNKFNNIFEQSIHLKYVNKLGEIGWTTVVKSPVSLQNLKIVDFIFTDNSPVYILCDYGFDGLGQGGVREDNTDLLNNKYALWAYDPEISFLKEFDLRIKSRWINGVKLAINKKEQLILSGFINETRALTVNGVYSLIINPDLTVENSSYYKYKKSFFEKFVEPKKLDKVKELSDIQLRECIALEDNSFFVLGEHYYHYTDRNYDPRTNITTTTENYNFNSILVAYFDAQGNHMWTDRIPKFQHTINDYGYYSSFSTMQYKNELYLFFNDTERNNGKALNDYFNYDDLVFNRRFQITSVHINEAGIQSRKALVNTNNNFMLRAKPSLQVEAEHFYLLGEIGKSRRVFEVCPRD